MITPHDKGFATLLPQLHRDLPPEPRTRSVKLAASAWGILRSKRLPGGQIVTASPWDGTRDSLTQRGQRWRKNAGVTVAPSSQPLAVRLVKRLVAGGARVPLPLDRTEWGATDLLYVCVGWRGRAWPVLGRMLAPGASSFVAQKEWLAVVAGWLPPHAQGLLLGDREFGTGVLARGARQQGWGVCLRVRAQEDVRRAGAAYVEPLPLLLAGARRLWPQVTFPQLPAGSGLRLALYWAPPAAEPWFLIPTEPRGNLACASYHNRFRIAEMLKGCKNAGRGFGWELTGVRQPDRLARLRVALGYTGWWLWGAQVISSGQQRLIDNVRTPTLSLFQTGLRFVMRLWQRGQLVRFGWHLSVLSEDTD